MFKVRYPKHGQRRAEKDTFRTLDRTALVRTSLVHAFETRSPKDHSPLHKGHSIQDLKGKGYSPQKPAWPATGGTSNLLFSNCPGSCGHGQQGLMVKKHNKHAWGATRQTTAPTSRAEAAEEAPSSLHCEAVSSKQRMTGPTQLTFAMCSLEQKLALHRLPLAPKWHHLDNSSQQQNRASTSN